MLTALRKNGEPFSLVGQYSREILLKLRDSESFYCPHCSGKVILKLGLKKIFHFSHESFTSCTEHYERESEYHLLGKLHLYNWLKEKGVTPIMEPYFPTFKQRADISFFHRNKQYVIEFQCSTIPDDIFRKRNDIYVRNEIIPFWILAGKNIKRKHTNQVILSNFDYLFLRNGSILSYCPISTKIILLNGILPVAARKAFTNFTIKNLSQLPIEELLEPKTQSKISLTDWLTEIRRFKNNTLISLQSRRNPLLLELYHHSFHISFLPPAIGLPLKNNLYIETAPFVWQCFLFIDVFMNKRTDTVITFKQVYISILKRILCKQIKIRAVPGARGDEISELIKDYLQLLSDVKILERINDQTYRILNRFEMKKDMQEQIELEDRFYLVNEDKILNRLC